MSLGLIGARVSMRGSAERDEKKFKGGLIYVSSNSRNRLSRHLFVSLTVLGHHIRLK